MSYEVEIKAIRIPIEINIEGYNNEHDAFDAMYEKLDDINKRLKSSGIMKSSYFTLTNVVEGYTYLDLIYYYKQGSGEFYISNYINTEEFLLVKSLFDEVIKGFMISDFRKVHYSYYNGCDPMDCYKVENITREEIYG